MKLAALLNVPELANKATATAKAKPDKEPSNKKQGATYQDLISTFVLKKPVKFDNWSPYLFNRLLASQLHFVGLTSKLDKYVFKVDDSIMYGLYSYCIPKFDKAPFFTFTKGKAFKEFTEHEEEMKKLCKMSDKEVNLVRHLL